MDHPAVHVDRHVPVRRRRERQHRDVLGREWQLSTIQVDFIQPARLGCEYIAEDGAEHTPVLLHRAVTGTTGSIEARWTGIQARFEQAVVGKL